MAGIQVTIRLRRMLVAIGLVFLGATTWAIVGAPRLLAPPLTHDDLDGLRDIERVQAIDARLKAQNDIRATMLQAIGGAFLAVGAIATWYNVNINRSRHGIEYRGQITDRFTRAVDQLGNNNIDIRIGGIYALENIALESHADLHSVSQLLSAFCRGRMPWPPPDDSEWPADLDIREVPELALRARDVQTALEVLARLPSNQDIRYGLHDMDLRRLEFINGPYDLSYAKLSRSNLDGCELALVLLFNADISMASCRYATLTDVDLRNSFVVLTDFTNSVFSARTSFRGALEGSTKWPEGFDSTAAGAQDFRDAERQGEVHGRKLVSTRSDFMYRPDTPRRANDAQGAASNEQPDD